MSPSAVRRTAFTWQTMRSDRGRAFLPLPGPISVCVLDPSLPGKLSPSLPLSPLPTPPSYDFFHLAYLCPPTPWRVSTSVWVLPALSLWAASCLSFVPLETPNNCTRGNLSKKISPWAMRSGRWAPIRHRWSWLSPKKLPHKVELTLRGAQLLAVQVTILTVRGQRGRERERERERQRERTSYLSGTHSSLPQLTD